MDIELLLVDVHHLRLAIGANDFGRALEHCRAIDRLAVLDDEVRLRRATEDLEARLRVAERDYGRINTADISPLLAEVDQFLQPLNRPRRA